MAENSCLTPLQTYSGSGHLKYPTQIRCQGQAEHSAFSATRLLKWLSTDLVIDLSQNGGSDNWENLRRPSGPWRKNNAGSSSRIVQSDPVSAPHMKASTEWKNSTGVSIMGS